MEQITREEIIEMLAVAICPANCYNGVIAQNEQHGEIEQCRFCYERELAIASLQAAEPVATLKVRKGWGKTPTSILYDLVKLDEGDYPLFALPCPPAKASHWSANNPGRADQYMGEALAARRALGFSEDAEDVAPIDITNAIVELRQPAKAQVPEAGTLKQVIEMVEARSHIRENRMIDGVIFLRDLKAMLTASPAPTSTTNGCTCQGCGIIYTADLIVPDDWWEKIKPEGKAEGSGLLCPNCMMDRLVNRGWSAGHIVSPAPDHNGDGNEMVEELTDAAQEVLAWAETLRGIEVCDTKTGPSLDRLKTAIAAHRQQEEADR